MSYSFNEPETACEYCYTHHEYGQCEESRAWFAGQREAEAEWYSKQNAAWADAAADSWLDDEPVRHKPTGPYKSDARQKKVADVA